jgi:hypothetical protein
LETISEHIGRIALNYKVVCLKYIPAIQKANKLTTNFREIIIQKANPKSSTEKIDKGLYKRMSGSFDSLYSVKTGCFEDKTNNLLEIIFELFNRNWFLTYNILNKIYDTKIQIKFMRIAIDGIYKFNPRAANLFLSKVIEDNFPAFLQFFFEDLMPVFYDYY